jgi:hypothetical protein
VGGGRKQLTKGFSLLVLDYELALGTADVPHKLAT